MKISVEVTVDAPMARVWTTYTSPEDIVQWNSASDDWHTTRASVDLRVGGEFSSRMEAKDGSMGFDFAGVYTQVIEHNFLEYAFGTRLAQVAFTQKPEGVNVRVTFDAEESHSVTQQTEGWQAILNNFKRHTQSKESL
jgi:uncharacterized protein YndB with AHSA1/START domain